MDSIFQDTNFDAFVGFKGSIPTERGIMYPPDLFTYTPLITSLKNCFKNTVIYVGVDINDNLFNMLVNLKDISGSWSECVFDNREYNSNGVNLNNSQINFTEIFKLNNRITNASLLFAVNNNIGKGGLLIIEKDLLKTCYNINDVSGMFSNNSSLRGSVPEFTEASYPYLKIVQGYLSGTNKSNILNADNLEPRLIPQNWL